MVDFKRLLYGKVHKVKCYKCGKEMLIPNMMRTEAREKNKRKNLNKRKYIYREQYVTKSLLQGH